MTKDVYQFDISRAGRAADLHQLTEDIREDAMLDQAGKDELFELIRLKFCRLNHAAKPDPKTRWQA
ncbi:MAG TPA: hypothetical protein VK742_19180 [Candidatus Sulfotelmatobacter sp.]|jgi:hypothetical protein|nr:hypothetical protein [Candidatus Sulfotelmatobacter sp.]